MPMKNFKNIFSNKCVIILGSLLLIAIGLLTYTHYKMYVTHKKISEIEFKDSTNTFNKIYYEESIKALKKKNHELYDSLESSLDQIDYLIQFKTTHTYSTGKVIVKKIKDTIYIDSTKTPKTFEYTNTLNNDTMQYKLKINSSEEPNWYSLDIKTNNKYTIVNKEYENGMNHITIGDNTHSAEISDVTVFKKEKKKSLFNRFAVGPSITPGYDLVNKQWGVMVGVSITFDCK